jgi:chorismate mutase/prephenate dehydratase
MGQEIGGAEGGGNRASLGARRGRVYAPCAMPDSTLPATADIHALRAEIDRLDDAMHDLLMQRADVVARLAASRAKGQGPALRPGREAVILRRLLGRHQGALPRAALFRLWRELLAATTAMQAPLGVAAALDGPGVEVLRQHFGLASPIAIVADAPAMLAAMAAGGSALGALPWPSATARWWTSIDPGRAFITARLPLFGPSPAPVALLSPTPPDPSGDDATLLRLPAEGAAAALAAAGLTPSALFIADDLALAEIPGFHMDRHDLGTPLGAFALPLTA